MNNLTAQRSAPRPPASHVPSFSQPVSLSANPYKFNHAAIQQQLAAIDTSKPPASPLPVPHFNVPTISLQNLSEAARFLQPGDILIKYADGMQWEVDRQIWFGHKLALGAGRFHFNLPDPWRVTHCSLAQGGQLISDATRVPDGPNVRTIDFTKHEVLDDSMGVRYMVFRPKNPSFGAHAAENAVKFTTPFFPDPRLVETTAPFAVERGVYAMVAPAKMSPKGAADNLEAAIYGQILKPNELVPTPQGLRNFFCSNFVNWCYQSVEGDLLFRKLGIHFNRSDFETNGKLDPQKVSQTARQLSKNYQVAYAIHHQIFNKDANLANPLDTLDIVMNKGAFDLVGVLAGYVDYRQGIRQLRQFQ